MVVQGAAVIAAGRGGFGSVAGNGHGGTSDGPTGGIGGWRL